MVPLVQEHHRCGLFNLPHCVTILISVTIKYEFVSCGLSSFFNGCFWIMNVSCRRFEHLVTSTRAGQNSRNTGIYEANKTCLMIQVKMLAALFD